MAAGQKIGYRRVSSVDQNSVRQLDGLTLDKTFEDKCSGKDVNRPQLQAAIEFLREGDTLVCHSMDRLARNLGDLLKLVEDLTGRGVAVEFCKEHLTFTGEDSAMAKMMLGIMGSVAQFERSMIRERQREGVQIAKAAGKYKGGQFKLSEEKAAELRRRVAASESKASLAREFGISRQSLYSYLKVGDATE